MRGGVLCALLALGCGPDPTALERSCRGERVLECDPHEYTTARSASLMPGRLSPGEPGSNAMVRVEVDRCETAPAPVQVTLSALVGRPGGGVRVIDLGASVRDDGTRGDSIAGDGIAEATIGNPFGDEVPAEQTITVRFVPVIAGCTGDAIEIDYETGPAFVPPGP